MNRALPFVPRTTPGQVNSASTTETQPATPPAQDAPGATPVQVRPFATMAELSLLVDGIARGLHDAYAYLDGRTPETDPYERLTADQKALLREHAIVSIQSLCPWLHAAAATAATRVCANFDRGLHVYASQLARPSRVR